MVERLLVPYDASFCADRAVEHAMQLARAWNATLFVVALAPAGADGAQANGQLMDDLVAFARLGRRLGVDVDGSYLKKPNEALIRQLIDSHHIDHLVIALCDGPAAGSENGQLLRALAQNCPVPITTLEIHVP